MVRDRFATAPGKGVRPLEVLDVALPHCCTFSGRPEYRLSRAVDGRLQPH